MLLTCVLLRFDYSSYYENIKQYVVFIIKNSDMVSWKWGHVKSEKGTTLRPGCQLGDPGPPRPPLSVGPGICIVMKGKNVSCSGYFTACKTLHFSCLFLIWRKTEKWQECSSSRQFYFRASNLGWDIKKCLTKFCNPKGQCSQLNQNFWR